MLNNDWFDDFIAGSQVDETTDLGWLDSWSRSFPVVSKKTLRYSVASAMPIACDLLSNAPSCPIACDNVVAMPKCGPMPKWFRGGNIAPPAKSQNVNANSGDNPMVELRYNLFGKMLGNYASNSDAKFLSPEDFDKCFKG